MLDNLKRMLWQMVIPIAIGVGVAYWLFKDEFSVDDLAKISFGWREAVGIAVALLFVAGRDFGLTWRFHTIAKPSLSWGKALKVDLMCAFSSAVTPSAVGGSALAIFFLNTEGVKVGRATALTLTTLFLDELFFVIICPIVVLCLPFDQLFGGLNRGAFLQGLEIAFWLVYAGIVVWTAILFVGILLKPQWVRKMLVKLFSLPLLKRWHDNIAKVGDNIVATSEWIKTCSAKWWANVFFATVLSWFCRFLVVNALFWAFLPGVSPWLVFGRQLVVWVVLMVSPTPGGSGLSEWIFTEYYGDLISAPNMALVIALLWRLITYYIYLVIGVPLLTTYFRRKKDKSA